MSSFARTFLVSCCTADSSIFNADAWSGALCTPRPDVDLYLMSQGCLLQAGWVQGQGRLRFSTLPPHVLVIVTWQKQKNTEGLPTNPTGSEQPTEIAEV